MNLVATFNFGDVPYAEYTVPFMRAYAERCGADFVEYKQFPRRQLYPSAPSWFHIEAIRQFASQEYYTKLLLLDADQLVMPSCQDLFKGLGDHVQAVTDMGIPDGGNFGPWCREKLDESPVEGSYFNAGMLLLPLTAARRIAPRLEGPYPNDVEPLFEQHFLNQRIRQQEVVDLLPNEFNWCAPQFFEDSAQKKIVHFVGAWKNLLPAYVARLMCRENNANETLSAIGRRMGTDKGTDHSYLEVYEELLEPLRHRPMTMLEIGVYRGASLRMWQCWFPHAKVYGLDLDISGADAPNCELVAASQTDRVFIDARWGDDTFDLIIDDGSHRLADQILSLCYLWPKLKSGGIYVIEDIFDISTVKHFAPFHPMVMDRRHRRGRDDDTLLVFMK